MLSTLCSFCTKVCIWLRSFIFTRLGEGGEEHERVDDVDDWVVDDDFDGCAECSALIGWGRAEPVEEPPLGLVGARLRVLLEDDDEAEVRGYIEVFGVAALATAGTEVEEEVVVDRVWWCGTCGAVASIVG